MITDREHRRKEGLNLHKIEGNPLTPEEIEMFEMFDREGFSDEQRREHIKSLVQKSVGVAEPA